MQKTNSKYVVYRNVITGSYKIFETNDKKEAIKFIKSIRYQIIKKPPMDSGYYLVIKRQLRIQNNELLNWVKEQKQSQSLTLEERRKLRLLAVGVVVVVVALAVFLSFS